MCCNALCSLGVPCLFVCFSLVCEVCLCVYFYAFVQDEWWGFPVYIAQLNMPVIAVWAEHSEGSLLKTPLLVPYGAVQTNYKITLLFNYSTVSCVLFCFLFYFVLFCFNNSSVLQLLIAFILAAGMLCVGVLTCVCRWGISTHGCRSLTLVWC